MIIFFKATMQRRVSSDTLHQFSAFKILHAAQFFLFALLTFASSWEIVLFLFFTAVILCSEVIIELSFPISDKGEQISSIIYDIDINIDPKIIS